MAHFLSQFLKPSSITTVAKMDFLQATGWPLKPGFHYTYRQNSGIFGPALMWAIKRLGIFFKIENFRGPGQYIIINQDSPSQ